MENRRPSEMNVPFKNSDLTILQPSSAIDLRGSIDGLAVVRANGNRSLHTRRSHGRLLIDLWCSCSVSSVIMKYHKRVPS